MTEITQVFTPGYQPVRTYVKRKFEFEKKLEDALKTPHFLISISGPSKMGKSVLCNKVLGNRQLLVTSTEFKTSEQLWELVRNRLNQPTSSSQSASINGELSGNLLALGGKVESKSTETNNFRYSATNAFENLASSDKVLVIDDFHYLKKDLQVELCRQFKHAIERGAKIITICVTYRHDDPLRSNQDLQGRIEAINIPPWSTFELEEIVELGFNALKHELSVDLKKRICNESLGSPHITQYVCLKLAQQKINFIPFQVENIKINLQKGELESIFKNAAQGMKISSQIESLRKGPKTKGKGRKLATLKNGSKEDAYSILLSVIAYGEPKSSLHYTEIASRAKKICSNPPSNQQFANAAIQMSNIAKQTQLDPDSSALTYLEWDKTESVLHLPNPMFVFSLRWG